MKLKPKPMKKIILIFILHTFLAGCSGLKFPSVHKIGIQQGNIIDEEMTDSDDENIGIFNLF